MGKYRKKPVVVDAVRYESGLEDGFNAYSIGVDISTMKPIRGEFIGYFPKGGLVPKSRLIPVIETLEGRMEISEGDWIITGIAGERYPCKPEIFEATYEEVRSPGEAKSAD